MVQRHGSFHQIAISGDFLDIGENFHDFRRGERAFDVVADICCSIDAGCGCNRRPQQRFHVARMDARISKQCDALFLGLIAKCKKLIPRFRKLPAIFFKERFIVNQAHGRSIERRQVDLTIAVRRAFSRIQDTFQHLLFQRGSVFQARAFEDVCNIKQRIFTDHRRN